MYIFSFVQCSGVLYSNLYEALCAVIPPFQIPKTQKIPIPDLAREMVASTLHATTLDHATSTIAANVNFSQPIQPEN